MRTLVTGCAVDPLLGSEVLGFRAEFELDSGTRSLGLAF